MLSVAMHLNFSLTENVETLRFAQGDRVVAETVTDPVEHLTNRQ